MACFEEYHGFGVVVHHLYTFRVYFQMHPVRFAPGKLSTSEVFQLSQSSRVPTRRVKASTAPGFRPGFCFGVYTHSAAGSEVSIAPKHCSMRAYTISNNASRLECLWSNAASASCMTHRLADPHQRPMGRLPRQCCSRCPRRNSSSPPTSVRHPQSLVRRGLWRGWARRAAD